MADRWKSLAETGGWRPGAVEVWILLCNNNTTAVSEAGVVLGSRAQFKASVDMKSPLSRDTSGSLAAVGKTL